VIGVDRLGQAAELADGGQGDDNHSHANRTAEPLSRCMVRVSLQIVCARRPHVVATIRAEVTPRAGRDAGAVDDRYASHSGSSYRASTSSTVSRQTTTAASEPLTSTTAGRAIELRLALKV